MPDPQYPSFVVTRNRDLLDPHQVMQLALRQAQTEAVVAEEKNLRQLASHELNFYYNPDDEWAELIVWSPDDLILETIIDTLVGRYGFPERPEITLRRKED